MQPLFPSAYIRVSHCLRSTSGAQAQGQMPPERGRHTIVASCERPIGGIASAVQRQGSRLAAENNSQRAEERRRAALRRRSSIEWLAYSVTYKRQAELYPRMSLARRRLPASQLSGLSACCSGFESKATMARQRARRVQAGLQASFNTSRQISPVEGCTLA